MIYISLIKRKELTDKLEFSEVDIMVCPFCNNEMIKGKLLGDRSKLKWVPDDDNQTFGVWVKNAKVLANRTGGIFDRHRVDAYVCENCKKLIADLL